jgi:outer membrane protein OmpA-like peptidoglycan-associated protein
VTVYRVRRKGVFVSEQNIEEQVQVRRVTDVQASWTEHERGEPGSFTLQLILDDGAEEYVLLPTADDIKVMMKIFKSTNVVYFDLGNKVLKPSNIR